jgi:hypothetical protein
MSIRAGFTLIQSNNRVGCRSSRLKAMSGHKGRPGKHDSPGRFFVERTRGLALAFRNLAPPLSPDRQIDAFCGIIALYQLFRLCAGVVPAALTDGGQQ